MRLGNGRSAHFLVGQLGPTSSINMMQVIPGGRLGIPLNATVTSLNREGNWLFPPARLETMLELYTYMTTIELTCQPDCYEWEIQGTTTTVNFSTWALYTYLRGTILEEAWTKAIWFPRAIPKHSFHSWLMVLNHCPTRDRIHKWGSSSGSYLSPL